MGESRESAREFLESAESKSFKILCDEANTEPTVRQVRKFWNKRGKAFKQSQILPPGNPVQI